MNRANTSRKLVFLLILIVLPFVFFAPAWMGGVALVQGDGWVANFGLRFLTGKIMRQGGLPLWNPYIFGGMPLLASIYPGALYPFNWIFALLRPGIAMQLVVITTYHIALIGAYLYARSIEVSRIGALVTSIIFAFGGYMVMSMGQTSNIATAAWLGWILLSIERLSQSETWSQRMRWTSLGAIVIAIQFFAGVPQITWYTALVCGAYALFVIATRGARTQFIGGLVWMLMCAALLSSIQLLPLRELQAQGARAAISYETFAEYSLPPRQLFALVFPYFFGGATMPPYRIPYWGEWGIYITCGYVGLPGLMLAFAALVRPRNRMTLFWAFVALASLILAFGDHLPFGLNHLLYALPVNNLFRASFRHMFEFTFAVAVLAGLGLQRLAIDDAGRARRIVLVCIIVNSGIVALTFISHTFLLFSLSKTVKPEGSNSIAIPEAYVPLIFLVLSAIALYGFTRFRNAAWSAVVVLVLIADLSAFGQFLEWRGLTFNVDDALRTNPQTVEFIKAREPDLHSFRILSYSPNLYGANPDLLNMPNVSIARGIESVNGYDMLQMSRPAQMMGDMSALGQVRQISALGASDQAFNLLNVKYLLWERPTSASDLTGIGFRENSLAMDAQRNKTLSFEFDGATATELVLESALSHSGNVPDGAVVVKLKIHTKDGHEIDREVQAGRDTSEWAFDREDVRASVKHSRAEISQSVSAGSFSAHFYLGRIQFERSAVDRIGLEYARQDAQIVIARASLRDSETGSLTPVSYHPTSERWRKLATFGAVDIYENLNVLPRAWFVERQLSLEDSEALSRIQGREGVSFNPWQVALVSQEDALPAVGRSLGASATVTRYESNRIGLATRNDQPGFLVLSEILYPGWIATIDGKPATIIRTNYVLRGISVPAGEHQIEFAFRPQSLRNGAYLSAVGIVLLVASGIFAVMTGRRRTAH